MPQSNVPEDTFCSGKHVYETFYGPLVSCSQGQCAPKPQATEATLDAEAIQIIREHVGSREIFMLDGWTEPVTVRYLLAEIERLRAKNDELSELVLRSQRPRTNLQDEWKRGEYQ